MPNYDLLCRQLSALLSGYPVADLSNASALLWQALPELNWAGFYLREGDVLILGPFQGKPACIRIPLGRGVCGTAAAEDRCVLVPDVHQFPGHIACDCASNSELVIPLRKNGAVVGVLDLDSPQFNRFSEEDQVGLERFAGILQQSL